MFRYLQRQFVFANFLMKARHIKKQLIEDSRVFKGLKENPRKTLLALGVHLWDLPVWIEVSTRTHSIWTLPDKARVLVFYPNTPSNPTERLVVIPPDTLIDIYYGWFSKPSKEYPFGLSPLPVGIIIEKAFPFEDNLVVGEGSAEALFSNFSKEEISRAMAKVETEIGAWPKPIFDGNEGG